MKKPKINKAKILEALKSDYKAATTLRDEVDVDIKNRRKVFNGDPYGNEEKDKSSIVVKIAKRQHNWLHASLKDPFVSNDNIVSVTPITASDPAGAKEAELLLNYQFCRDFDRYNFMTKALKILEIDATVVVQTGWEYEEKVVKEFVQQVTIDEFGNELITEVEEEVVIPVVNRPTASICRNEDIFIDPTCEGDFDKAQFVIYRYETDYSNLSKNPRYKNLEKLKKDVLKDIDYDPEDDTSFEFKDFPRKKIVVYEYWGNYDINDDGVAEPIVCVWVNDIILRLEDNPYPDKKVPFLVCNYDQTPFKLYGENDIDNIEDQQQIITAITRGIINNMAASNNGQIGIRKNALDPVQKKRMLSGKNFEFNGSPADIWQGSYNNIPSSAFNMLSMVNNEVDSITGVKSFSGGINGNSLGGTATAARGALDSTSIRRIDKVRNISENLIKPLMRKWLAYDKEFLRDEEIIRITETEHTVIRKANFDGELDISISVSTPEDDAAKRNELGFLLQTLGSSLPFEFTKVILAKIAKLSRMPDLEKNIENMQPPKDEMAEQIKQLELEKLNSEIAKTKAEIRKIYSEAVENKQGDLAKKTAEAELLQAQTELLKSKADMEDLKFIKTETQSDEQFQLEKLKLQQAHEAELAKLKQELNLLQMKYQKDSGDNNLGVLD